MLNFDQQSVPKIDSLCSLRAYIHYCSIACIHHSLILQALEKYLKSGVRTLFTIECNNGKAIRAHSHYSEENEILLLPGTYFRVVGKSSPAKDLYIIHLRETAPPRPYLEPPFTTTLSETSNSTVPATPKQTPVKQNIAISKEVELPGAFAAVSISSKKSQEFATPDPKKKLS
ncbi:unnamed protein product [Rotaria sordida]|uniref:Mono(ADP-ribosyl)transferase n=1 Tax=Rotaria sordida TaxID=392033 RepID=A0A814IRF0_9BILA|nr:unnamed protein product [Rotaria sordida]